MANKTVCLMDNSLNGHHKVYLEALKKINITNDISKEFLTAGTKEPVKYFRDRKRILDYAIDQAGLGNDLHLLYIDNLFPVGAFVPMPKYMKIVGTLHHFPNGNGKQALLKRFSKKLSRIIVHSDFIAKQLDAIGIHNHVTIDYPVFHELPATGDKQSLRAAAGITSDHLVVSALGGTRYDKGLDILLQSLQYVDESVKRKLLINIAGKEETYKRAYIQEQITRFGVTGRLELKLLTDEEFAENIMISDAIILPYRNIFSGNSGPMTEGVFNHKAIIGPDRGNLGYLIKQYKLGYVFEAENPNSIAEALNAYVQHGWQETSDSREYINRLTIERFVERHMQLYDELCH